MNYNKLQPVISEKGCNHKTESWLFSFYIFWTYLNENLPPRVL